MRLSDRIAAAGLAPGVARTFADGLLEVAGVDGVPDGDEAALIARLLGDIAGVEGVEPAPFEALWPHAQLFLTARLYIAVIDGSYGIEEARRLSEFAHRLGFSAHQLAELESRVFRELQERGARAMERDRARQGADAAHAALRGPLDPPEPPLTLDPGVPGEEEVTELDATPETTMETTEPGGLVREISEPL